MPVYLPIVFGVGYWAGKSYGDWKYGPSHITQNDLQHHDNGQYFNNGPRKSRYQLQYESKDDPNEILNETYRLDSASTCKFFLISNSSFIY